jgi:hypothetical protein
MFKKIVKIVLWIAIVFVAIILIALLIIRIKFPPQKVKALAISEIENAINRKTKIGETWFNPLKGFILNNVVIYQQSPQDTSALDTTIFFHSNRLHLKYRFLSLLKREIEINNILIDQPEINLNQDQNQDWNFEDLIAPDTTVIQPATHDTGTVEFILPVSIKLKNFSINNFTTNIYIDQADTVYTIRSGGLSVNVDDLFLPRKSLDEFKKDARADLRLFSDEKPWELTMRSKSSSEKTELSSRLNLDIKFNISGFNNVKSEGKLALTNLLLKSELNNNPSSSQKIISLPKVAAIFYALATDAEKRNLTLDHLAAQIGDETLFDIKGNITDFSNQPFFDLEVVQSEINLQNLISLILPLFPDTVQQHRKNISIAGLASFKGTKVKGNPLSEHIKDAMTVNLLFSLDNFYGSYVDPEMKLNNLKIRSSVTEVHNINGVQKADVWINASLDSIFMAVDTLKLGYGGLNLNFKTALNKKFLPDSIATRFTMDNFLGVPLNFLLNFKSIDGLNKFQANSNLIVNQLMLGNIPESTLEGFVDLSLILHAETLDKIDLNLKVGTDIIGVQTETEPLILYPMDIQGFGTLSTDTSFHAIKLNQFQMGVNNFASAIMHGNFLFEPQQRLNLVVDNLNIDHEKVMAIMPAQLLEGLETLKVTGSSKFTSEISIILPDNDEPIIDAKGRVSIHAGVEYPDEFFSLKRIVGIVNFNSDGESGKFDLEAILDSLIIEGVQDEPVRNMSLMAVGSFPDLETLRLDSSKLVAPGLMTQVFLKGQIDSLSGNMPTRCDGYLTFDSNNDTVPMLNFLKVSGKLSQKIDLYLVNEIAEIKGELNVDYLDVKYEDIAEFDSIGGLIHFALKYDIEQEKLIENPLNQPFFAEAGSYYYDLLRPYYRQNHKQFSFLRIGKIQSLDYYASDINFDIFISNERIEIPRFDLNAYDGNMSGLFYANLHEGKLDQIEWKIKANLSRLNSAKLIPTRRLKARGSDVNMNLELSGVGVDPASKLEVEGYLYVTKIGPQFTDNVLRSLDPKGTDKGIQGTRKLLNWGYKPKLLSFEVKHGNLYPTIHLVKGKLLTKLIPLNLSGGKIELARIPVKFFMKNMMLESQ